MYSLNQTTEILIGGSYTGNRSWNKTYSEIDNCLKIYLLISGELYLSGEEQKFLLKKDKLYFINGSKLKYQHCNGSFSTDWLHFIPKDLVIRQTLLAMPLVVEIPVELHLNYNALKNINSLISHNYPSYTEFYLATLRMQTFLQSILVYLLEQYSFEDIKPTNIERIEPAIQYINNHFTEDMRLEHLAQKCCMSANYFYKLFTSALQTTPTNYISLVRMNRALQLLVNNEYNIKEIAYKVGFNDDAYFSRVFKKYYGITPGEYKKKRNELLF